MEEEVKLILGDPEMEKRIRKKQSKLMKDIMELNVNMEEFQKMMITASVPKKRDEGEGKADSPCNPDRMWNILTYSRKQSEEYYLSLLEQYRLLESELEKAQRVNICLETLPEELKEILVRLYEKKKTWECVEIELNLNHRCFAEKRTLAIRLLLQRYESNLSIRELIRSTPELQKRRRTRRGGRLELDGQLQLPIK